MVVDSAYYNSWQSFLIADKDVPVTTISWLEARLSMNRDLEMYFSGI